jgi:hypothetical protein
MVADPKIVGLQDWADRQNPEPAISFEDFYAVMPMHAYIYTRNGELWPAASINSRLPSVEVSIDENGKPVTVKAAQWLDQNRPVEQLTWAPGEPQIVIDRLVSNGGWIYQTGVSCFNLYLPPQRKPGDADQAEVWIEHVQKVYGDESDHIIKWLAHRVQRPGEKINHALLLGGAQGIGKDTILEPVKHAVGPWNFSEVSPTQILGRFNSFLKSVVLRVSEARDLGEFDRFGFYDHMKAITAAPPDVDLTRFSGHLSVYREGVSNGEQRNEVSSGVSQANGRIGLGGPQIRGPVQGVWSNGLDDPKMGQASRARC